MQRRGFLHLGLLAGVTGMAGVACRRSILEIPPDAASLTLSSSAFTANSALPQRYTCDGEDVSPPLSWDEPPAGTASFALICDDPDAPFQTWVHWVTYNLPAETRSLPAAVPRAETLPNGGRQGTNDFKTLGYGGPCPPGGEHRYFFKLYALDAMLDLAPGATKAEVEAAIAGRILAFGELVGLYSR